MGVVLITGCSSGIGLETALAFARRGDEVIATIRDPAGRGLLGDRAAAEALDSIAVEALDVTDGEAIRHIVDDIRSSRGRIDVLVNNAGIAIPGVIEEIAEADARAVFETNFWGPFRLTQAVLPHMRAAGGGVIVNVSSFGTRLPGRPANAVYGLTKAALSRLTESLRAELAGTGVRVVAVEPGMYATNVYRTRPHIDPSSPYAALLAAYDETLANGIANGADPAEVGDAIVALTLEPDPPARVLVGDDAKARFKAAGLAELS